MGTLLSLSKPCISQYRTDLFGGFWLFVVLFVLFIGFCFVLVKSWFLSQSNGATSKLFDFWVCFGFFFKGLRGS